MNPAGRAALVVGGGRGLMASVSRELSRLGAPVAVHCHSHRAEAEALVTELQAGGGRAVCLQADLRDPRAISLLAADVQLALGPVAMLVYGASPFERVGALGAGPAQWSDALELELRAPALLVRELEADLRAARGLVVLMGDLSAEQGWPAFGPHSVAKAGAPMLARMLSLALAPEARVNVLSPGALADHPSARLADAVPLGRLATPGDVCRALRYLIEADYVTGQVLRVEGGRLARAR